MLQCPVWTPMERMKPLHFKHYVFNAHVAEATPPHFQAYIYCQRAPVVLEILLLI